MNKTMRSLTLFTLSFSIVIYVMTILYTIQGAPLWTWAVSIFLLSLQSLGLLYYLHRDPSKKENNFLKLIIILLKLSTLGVLVWLWFGLIALSSQYHNLVTPTEADKDGNITIEETEYLYIMYPNYSNILFTTKRASRSDENIIYSSGAAFQQTYNIFFNRNDIIGNHVENGILYEGYPKDSLGAFTYYNNEFHFVTNEYAKEELANAANNNGIGFQQFLLVDNGTANKILRNEYRCYRVLAEIDGKLCIIDSKKQIEFNDFMDSLVEANVKNAVYLDMGSGWNYSWYRDNSGKTNTLIGIPWIFSHNWLVFEK